ncbi:MAG: hypothetical protein WCP03_02210, partial [Candidatus Saccharibacteria bacterium]
MNLLLFGGNSIRNKDWINQCAKEFQPLFKICKVHHYEHWQKQEDSIDIPKELHNIALEVINFNNYAVFAKSIGMILAARAIYEGIIKPQKCIFLGLPIGVINKDKNAISDYFKSIKKPILFIQNNNDPVGSDEQVRNYLLEINPSDYSLELYQG